MRNLVSTDPLRETMDEEKWWVRWEGEKHIALWNGRLRGENGESRKEDMKKEGDKERGRGFVS